MVLLHNTRLGEAYPRRHRRERVRRPLRLQPLPLGTGRARIRGRALPGHHRQLSDPRHLDRDPGLPALRPRLPPRIRADEAEPLVRQSSRPLLLRSLPGRRQGGGHRRRRPARRVREDVESWLASDFDLPDDMAEAFWLADTRSRRRARAVPRLALRRGDLAGSRDQGGDPAGRELRRHPVGGAADRRRLVRGHRPQGARRGRRHHRGLLL